MKLYEAFTASKLCFPGAVLIGSCPLKFCPWAGQEELSSYPNAQLLENGTLALMDLDPGVLVIYRPTPELVTKKDGITIVCSDASIEYSHVAIQKNGTFEDKETLILALDTTGFSLTIQNQSYQGSSAIPHRLKMVRQLNQSWQRQCKIFKVSQLENTESRALNAVLGRLPQTEVTEVRQPLTHKQLQRITKQCEKYEAIPAMHEVTLCYQLPMDDGPEFRLTWLQVNDYYRYTCCNHVMQQYLGGLPAAFLNNKSFGSLDLFSLKDNEITVPGAGPWNSVRDYCLIPEFQKARMQLHQYARSLRSTFYHMQRVLNLVHTLPNPSEPVALMYRLD